MQRLWLRALPLTLSLTACGGANAVGSTSDTDGEDSSSSGDVDPSATSLTTTTSPSTTAMATTSSGPSSSTTNDDTSSSTEPDTGDSSTGEPVACGNGDVDEGEQCDDGNDVDSDGCNVDCVVSGSTIWELEHDVDGFEDAARGVAIAADGRVVVVGETRESTDGAYDVLAVGVGPTGTVTWEYRYDSASAMESPGGTTDRAYDVAISDDGDCYVSGHELFPLDRDSFAEHVMITKLDTDGEEVWRVGAEDTTRGRGYGLALGPDDELFVVGTHGSTGFVSKYNTNGLHFWTEDRDGSGGCNGCDRLSGVRPTDDGGVIVAGTIDNDDYDVYVAQFDAAGGETWTILEEVVGDQNAGPAAASGDGTLVLVSHDNTTELRRYDAAGDVEWSLGSLAPTNSYVYDVASHIDGGFVVLSHGYLDQSALSTVDRYDAAGALLWSRELETPFDEGGHEMRAVRVGPDGRVAVAGTRGTVVDDYDVWVVVLAP